MKKIRCNSNPEDFMAVTIFAGCVYIDTQQGDESTEIELSPDKIRKLRKQLKRALIEIEGEPDDSIGKAEYKPGDSVYLAEGDDEGDDWYMSPSVAHIDISKPVTLNHRNEKGNWSLTYTLLDGSDGVGYAFEKSFGRRA